MIKPREMTEQEKELIEKIKKQNIASYELSRSYTHIKWFDKENNELGFLFSPTGYVVDAVIEQWKKCKEVESK